MSDSNDEDSRSCFCNDDDVAEYQTSENELKTDNDDNNSTSSDITTTLSELPSLGKRSSQSVDIEKSRFATAVTGKKHNKKHQFAYNVTQRIDIVREAVERKNMLKPTARKYKIEPKSLRNWILNMKDLMEKANVNPKALTTNKGPVVNYKQVEKELYEWVAEMRLDDISLTTRTLILHAFQIANQKDYDFFDKDKKTAITGWVYRFLDRWDLSIRCITRVGQKTSGHLESVRRESVRAINERFRFGGSLSNVPKKFWLNMDQTCVEFESKFRKTVAKKGSKTVSSKDSGSNQKRCTVCITVAADGTVLPPFFIFIGTPGKSIEQEIRRLGIPGCAQLKGWFDEEVGPKWIDQILRPYIGDTTHDVFLLLDHFKCHMQQSFVTKLNNLGVDVDYIPAGYTCVLQPVDVGFNAPFKRHIKNSHQDWCIDKYKNLANNAKFPTPIRTDIIKWVNEAISMISEESIRKTFLSIGYFHPEDEELVINDELEGHVVESIEQAGSIDLRGVNLFIPEIIPYDVLASEKDEVLASEEDEVVDSEDDEAVDSEDHRIPSPIDESNFL